MNTPEILPPTYHLDGSPLVGTLAEFFDANTFDADEREAMLALQPGESFSGGGGAWAGWVLERVK